LLFESEKILMKKIGIYSGSFNPVHIGHISLAKYLLKNADLDEVWMVLSPQNPLKENSVLLPDNVRYEMLKLALCDERGILPCDVELKMPKPSFTVETLRRLSVEYTGVEFSLIIGADNLAVFDKWREYQYILDNYRLIVYPRKGNENQQYKKYSGNILMVDAPLFDVSSTQIRERLKNGLDVSSLVPMAVWNFIKENNLYK